jgi:hypothetical protein
MTAGGWVWLGTGVLSICWPLVLLAMHWRRLDRLSQDDE